MMFDIDTPSFRVISTVVRHKSRNVRARTTRVISHETRRRWMTLEQPLTRDEIRKDIVAAAAGHWKLLLVQGLLLQLLGLLAFTMPVWSTLVVDILIGWLFFGGGLVRTVTLIRAKHLPGYWWSLAAGILATAIGLLLAVNPFRGILTLTMLLMVLFTVEGLTAIFSSLDFRRHSRQWGWLLFSGLIDLLLVFLIWDGWPGTAAWAIGMLAGINLFFLGLPLVVLAFAVRPNPHRIGNYPESRQRRNNG